MSKLSPFDFLKTINMTKADIMVDAESEKAYVPFIVNRGLSYFGDTVLFANEMNLNPHIDSKMQYEFLRGIVRKRKRFSKWHKAVPDADIDIIKEYYGYSTRKAVDVLTLLCADDIAMMKSELDKGGISK